MIRHRLHDIARQPCCALKLVALFPIGAFTCDGAGAIAVNAIGAISGVPWPLGSVPILDDAVDGKIAVGCRVKLCKRTLSENNTQYQNNSHLKKNY